MSTLITIYIICLVAIAAYVAINVFHLIRFRIGFRGDKTGIAIAIYLIIMLSILALSWLGGIIAFQSVPSSLRI